MGIISSHWGTPVQQQLFTPFHHTHSMRKLLVSAGHLPRTHLQTQALPPTAACALQGSPRLELGPELELAKMNSKNIKEDKREKIKM